MTTPAAPTSPNPAITARPRTRQRQRCLDLGLPREIPEEITDHRKIAFLRALEHQMGVIKYACESCNISRRTIYYWMDNDPVFKREVDSINEVQIDFVENKLISNIREGKEKSIIFYLSTKGRNRGYGQHVRVSGDPDAPLNVTAEHTFPEIAQTITPTALAQIAALVHGSGLPEAPSEPATPSARPASPE